MKSDIRIFKKRFSDYVKGFYTSDSGNNRAISLKEAHTGRVCRNALMLGNRLRLSEDELRAVEVAALYHDIGRFRQYALYGTFKDSVSENHALLGLAEIEEHSLLDGLDEETAAIVTSAIRWHNALGLPKGMDDACMLQIRLLRDADKLDIWKVFTEHYEKRATHPNKAVELDLPDDDGCSHRVVKDLGNRDVVRMQDLKSLNDFKLLQISWVYDINFKPAMETLLDKGYIDRLAASLPDTEEICSALQSVRDYCLIFIRD